MVEIVKQPIERTSAHQRAQIRREHRRANIVRAAEAELAECGFDGLTLTAVGNRVGLSKAALYYYVEDRDDLLALVLADALADIRAEAAKQDVDGPIEAIRAFATAHVRRAVESPSGKLIASSVLALSASAATRELLRSHTEAFLALVHAAVRSGSLRDIPDSVVAPTFFGAMNAIAIRFDPRGADDIDTAINLALDMLLGGWVLDDRPINRGTKRQQ